MENLSTKHHLTDFIVFSQADLKDLISFVHLLSASELYSGSLVIKKHTSSSTGPKEFLKKCLVFLEKWTNVTVGAYISNQAKLLRVATQHDVLTPSRQSFFQSQLQTAPFPLEHPNHVSLLPQPHACPSITPKWRYEEAHGFNRSRLHHGNVRYQPSSTAALAGTCQATLWWIAHKHAITHSWAWAHSDQRRRAGKKTEQKRDRRGRDVWAQKSGGRMGGQLRSVMSLIIRKSTENQKAGKQLQFL